MIDGDRIKQGAATCTLTYCLTFLHALNAYAVHCSLVPYHHSTQHGPLLVWPQYGLHIVFTDKQSHGSQQAVASGCLQMLLCSVAYSVQKLAKLKPAKVQLNNNTHRVLRVQMKVHMHDNNI